MKTTIDTLPASDSTEVFRTDIPYSISRETIDSSYLLQDPYLETEELKAFTNFDFIESAHSTDIFITFFILFLLGIFVILKQKNKYIVKAALEAVVNYNRFKFISSLSYANKNFLFIASFFIASLSIALNLTLFTAQQNLIPQCLIYCIVLIVLHLAFISILHCHQVLFRKEKVNRLLIVNAWLNYIIYGIVLAPCAILYYLNESPIVNTYLIYFSLIITILALFIDIFRSSKILFNYNVSKFYFILYLCSLKLLPILVLLKYTAFL